MRLAVAVAVGVGEGETGAQRGAPGLVLRRLLGGRGAGPDAAAIAALRAHGRRPCGCPACIARGEYNGRRLRERYEREASE